MTLVAKVYCHRPTAEARAYLVVWDNVWLEWVFLRGWHGLGGRLKLLHNTHNMADIFLNIALCCCYIWWACSSLMCFALCYSCTRKISVNEGSSTDCSDFLLGLQLELLDKFRTLEGGWLPLLPVDVIDPRGTLLAVRLDCQLAGRLPQNIIYGERLKHDYVWQSEDVSSVASITNTQPSIFLWLLARCHGWCPARLNVQPHSCHCTELVLHQALLDWSWHAGPDNQWPADYQWTWPSRSVSSHLFQTAQHRYQAAVAGLLS